MRGPLFNFEVSLSQQVSYASIQVVGFLHRISYDGKVIYVRILVENLAYSTIELAAVGAA